MAIFSSDLEATIYIIIIAASLLLINRVVSYVLQSLKKVSVRQKNKINFAISLSSVILIIYLIIEGYPSFKSIDPTYTAILTGAISTAIAFASSGLFSNIVSGLVLLFISPIDIGDIVKIKGDKGIIRQIKLSKIILETFEGIFIEKSNSEVISSTIINYTKKLTRIKSFEDFLNKIQTPQVKGLKNLNLLNFPYLQELYKISANKYNFSVHNYTFKMQFPYLKFKKKINAVEELALKYKSHFGSVPWFNIIDLGARVVVKFSILTLDSETIIQYQPKFVKDMYKIIFQD